MPDLIYNKEEILKLIKAHQSIPSISYSDAFNVEERSATFLYGLANGKISLTDDAKEIVPEYFDILRNSKHPRIKDSLEEALKKFKAEYSKKSDTDLNEPIVPEEDTDEPHLKVEYVFSDDEIEHFNRLAHKTALDLTSEEYFFMANYLGQHIKYAENPEDAQTVQQQLAYLIAMARKKISAVFDDNSDVQPDKYFPNMVLSFGDDEQKKHIHELLNTGFRPDYVDETDGTPVTEEKTSTLEDNVPATEAEAPTVDDKAPVAEEETSTLEDNVPVVEKEAPATSVITELQPQSQEKAAKKSSKKSSATPKVKSNGTSLDAIVYNSKKLAALNAQELLNIAQQIEELPDEKQKRRMLSTFRYFVVQKLDNAKKVNLAEEGLDVLTQKYGTSKQRALFETKKPSATPIIIFDEPTNTPEIKDDTLDQTDKSKEDTSPKTTAKTIVLPDIASEPIEPEPEVEKKEEKVTKTPWYKRWIVQVAAAVVLFASTVAAATGIAKVFSSDKSSEDDNAPKTELKTNTSQQNTQDKKTIHFDQARTAQENTNTQKTIQAQKSAQAKQNAKLTKEDIKCVKNTAKFLKKIAQKHNISVEEAQQKLSNFVDNLDLPQGVSAQRMGYLTSIHALFPNSEFGIIANKMFDGENVKVSKDYIIKLDQTFSQHGQCQFGHKNNKLNSTLQVVQQAKSQVK